MKAVQEPNTCFAQEARISVLWDQSRMFIILVVQTPRIDLAAVQTATVSAAQLHERWLSAKAALRGSCTAFISL